MAKDPPFSLIVSDIDNTLFDWVQYYVHACGALLRHVEETINIPYAQLAVQARQVFETHGSIEYPFLVQELSSVISHYGGDIDRMLTEAVRPAREQFLNAAEPYLKPYDGVVATLVEVKKRFPRVPLVALTDAPRYVAMWKMNKLGLLDYFDAVYGLPDPRLPTSTEHGRVKVDPEILLKHLQQKNFGFKGKIRILPDDYEKPGTKGLKMVLIDFDMDEDASQRQRVLWIGDNLRKDVGLGIKLGVRTAWAEYGALVDPASLKSLHEFSPAVNIHKNVALPVEGAETPKPNHVLKAFADLLDYIK
jgi:phosphoglycolate phosphatase